MATKVLDEVNPTHQQIIEWGYDEEMWFTDQDEDLILHDTEYLPSLVQLASDVDCPKQDYCASILDYFIQQSFLFRNEAELKVIHQFMRQAQMETKWLKNWKKRFLCTFDIFMNPQSISIEMCTKIATELNIGDYSHRVINQLRTLTNGVIEYEASYGTYRQYFYINPQTGKWKLSKFNPLEQFS